MQLDWQSSRGETGFCEDSRPQRGTLGSPTPLREAAMLEALDRSVVDTSGNVVTKKTHGKTVFGTSFGAAVGTPLQPAVGIKWSCSA